MSLGPGLKEQVDGDGGGAGGPSRGEDVQAPAWRQGRASELHSIPGVPAESLNADPSNSEPRITERVGAGESGKEGLQRRCLCPQDFLSGNQEDVVVSKSLLPPEDPPATSLPGQQLSCSLQIIPVSLAAPFPDPYLFVSLVLIIGES